MTEGVVCYTPPSCLQNQCRSDTRADVWPGSDSADCVQSGHTWAPPDQDTMQQVQAEQCHEQAVSKMCIELDMDRVGTRLHCVVVMHWESCLCNWGEDGVLHFLC